MGRKPDTQNFEGINFLKLEELFPKELHCCVEGFRMLEELNSTMTMVTKKMQDKGRVCEGM